MVIQPPWSDRREWSPCPTSPAPPKGRSTRRDMAGQRAPGTQRDRGSHACAARHRAIRQGELSAGRRWDLRCLSGVPESRGEIRGLRRGHGRRRNFECVSVAVHRHGHTGGWLQAALSLAICTAAPPNGAALVRPMVPVMPVPPCTFDVESVNEEKPCHGHRVDLQCRGQRGAHASPRWCPFEWRR